MAADGIPDFARNPELLRSLPLMSLEDYMEILAKSRDHSTWVEAFNESAVSAGYVAMDESFLRTWFIDHAHAVKLMAFTDETMRVHSVPFWRRAWFKHDLLMVGAASFTTSFAWMAVSALALGKLSVPMMVVAWICNTVMAAAVFWGRRHPLSRLEKQHVASPDN